MFKILLIGVAILGINVLIQAIAYVYWLRWYRHLFHDLQRIQSNLAVVWILVSSVIYLTTLHLLQSVIWGVVYLFTPQITELSNLSDAVYFSIVTFTTLGYGDISIASHWRLLSGIEAINGIMLIGWSTAILYSLLQAIVKNKRQHHTPQSTITGSTEPMP